VAGITIIGLALEPVDHKYPPGAPEAVSVAVLPAQTVAGVIVITGARTTLIEVVVVLTQPKELPVTV
jgi:hypothetical protein